MAQTSLQVEPDSVGDQSTDSTTISVRVVEAVADATGTDPVDLSPSLYEAIDTDALDRLFEKGSPTRVTFEYAGHTVVVHGDESITVE